METVLNERPKPVIVWLFRRTRRSRRAWRLFEINSGYQLEKA
jgi:hypothetical protein